MKSVLYGGRAATASPCCARSAASHFRAAGPRLGVHLFVIISATPGDWRALKDIVGQILTECGFTVEVEKQVQTVRGGVELDVFAEEDIQGRKCLTVCECKHWKARVAQNTVHGFRTVLMDIGAHEQPDSRRGTQASEGSNGDAPFSGRRGGHSPPQLLEPGAFSGLADLCGEIQASATQRATGAKGRKRSAPAEQNGRR